MGLNNLTRIDMMILFDQQLFGKLIAFILTYLWKRIDILSPVVTAARRAPVRRCDFPIRISAVVPTFPAFFFRSETETGKYNFRWPKFVQCYWS